MTKLTDTQCVLLSTAATRPSLSIHPLPTALKPGGGLLKALASLISRGFAEERETCDPNEVSRTDGDLRFGLFATAAGLTAIGIEPESGTGDEQGSDPGEPSPKPARGTKSAAVVALLSRPEGATLGELIAATDWLPHTTRAALTGLRKKGHTLVRSKRDEATCYTITGTAA